MYVCFITPGRTNLIGPLDPLSHLHFRRVDPDHKRKPNFSLRFLLFQELLDAEELVSLAYVRSGMISASNGHLKIEKWPAAPHRFTPRRDFTWSRVGVMLNDSAL